MSKAEFEKLVKAHPVLTATNYPSPNGFPQPAGQSPNRTVTITYTVSASGAGGFGDEDEDEDPFEGPDRKPGGVKTPVPPPQPPPSGGAKTVVCTLELVEQPDQTWKVDALHIK